MMVLSCLVERGRGRGHREAETNTQTGERAVSTNTQRDGLDCYNTVLLDVTSAVELLCRALSLSLFGKERTSAYRPHMYIRMMLERRSIGHIHMMLVNSPLAT